MPDIGVEHCEVATEARSIQGPGIRSGGFLAADAPDNAAIFNGRSRREVKMATSTFPTVTVFQLR